MCIRHQALCRVKIRNPKLEIRNKRETVKVRIQKLEIGNELVWDFLQFEHLDLFRISEFEFRAWFYYPIA